MLTQVLIALFMGIIAGALDIIPMIRNPMSKQKAYRFSILSVFVQWVLLGLIIPFVSWNVEPWLRGFVIGFLGMAPTAALTYGRIESGTLVLRILVHGGIFGCLIAVAGNIFLK